MKELTFSPYWACHCAYCCCHCSHCCHCCCCAGVAAAMGHCGGGYAPPGTAAYNFKVNQIRHAELLKLICESCECHQAKAMILQVYHHLSWYRICGEGEGPNATPGLGPGLCSNLGIGGLFLFPITWTMQIVYR